jgi:hypothetical protein
MTTNNERSAKLDRAARFLTVADLLSITHLDAYTIADCALDFDTADDVLDMLPEQLTSPVPLHAFDALLAYAQASFSSDDDYDDFRHELRVLIPGLADDVDASWDDDDI